MQKKETFGLPTLDEALIKLQRYCAYQDRCHKEVREKLSDLGIWGDDAGQVIVELIEEKFLDEERFARSFVRGKHRFKKWGRIKIERELKKKDITGYCLKMGFQEIDDEEYLETLTTIITKKNQFLKAKNEYERKVKLAKYAMTKGYES
ncbi:MAG: regulatory protein RecX, partial [Saprospiraceae bacterium]